MVAFEAKFGGRVRRSLRLGRVPLGSACDRVLAGASEPVARQDSLYAGGLGLEDCTGSRHELHAGLTSSTRRCSSETEPFETSEPLPEYETQTPR